MTEHLLSKAFQRREIDQRLMRTMKHDEQNHGVQHPVITISREFGSGGRSIGQLVANQLNFAYYDRELIDQVAERVDSDHEHVAKRESGRHDAMSDMLLSLLDRRHVPDTVYLRSLLRVLHSVAQKGHVVIIGRGGGCVITGALRIRVIAPFDQRVERVAEVQQISAKEAHSVVLEADHSQKRFLRGFFGCDPEDMHLYDLVINTSGLSLEHAAELISTRLHQTWKEEK